MISSQRIALCIEYDGSRFCGWQMQSEGTRTVQLVLEQALSAVADHEVRVVCAGRTDTGVHASGQVVHFDCHTLRENKAWVLGVNTHLPDDACVRWSQPVSDDFNARFSATKRYYRYVILNRRARPAILYRKVSWVHGQLDHHAMHMAAQCLCGDLDFSAFRSAACQAKHAQRIVESVKVSRHGDYIYIDVHANAFLHHMVRNIVGTLLKTGQGERPVEWVREVLQSGDRELAGPTALADGLYLVAISYPESYGLPTQVEIPSFHHIGSGGHAHTC